MKSEEARDGRVVRGLWGARNRPASTGINLVYLPPESGRGIRTNRRLSAFTRVPETACGANTPSYGGGKYEKKGSPTTVHDMPDGCVGRRSTLQRSQWDTFWN